MILHRVHLQAFECSICHKGREIPKSVLGDPFELTACEEKQKLQQTPVSGGVQ
jgi:hypothetical protein